MERSTASGWKTTQPQGMDLELPSGNVALVRPIKPEAFLQGGMIPDPLAQLVTKAINSKKGLPPSALKDIAEDKTKLAAAMEMFDRVLCYAIVQPPVAMPPTCIAKGEDDKRCGLPPTDAKHFDTAADGYHRCIEGERDPELLYADVVDMEDKMFVFNWCVGGTKDIASFRDELASGMGDVPADQALPHKAK